MKVLTRKRFIKLISASVLLFGLPALVGASVITVPNNSFEDGINDWSAPFGGVGTDGSAGYTGSDGSNNLYLQLPGFGGPSPNYVESAASLGSAVAGTYTLTVAGGQKSSGQTTAGSYTIELFGGGVLIASQTLNDPKSNITAGTWQDMTATASIGFWDAAVGGDLTIRLTATGPGTGEPQGQLDNVRLDFVAAVGSEITVPNRSFEDGINDWSAPLGWAGTDGSAGYTGSDGSNHLYLQLPGNGGPSPNYVESAASLGSAGAGTYTLTVAGGQKSGGQTTAGSYTIELFGGGTLIASQTLNDPKSNITAGTWQDMTASASIGSGHAAVGGDLTIRLSATGTIQGQLDNVRLHFEDPPPPSGTVISIN